ncbi:MAG: hypothetical protein JWQ19_115 [Subtercola sp.]|nr:hypothetical protein [Subtercola sp.]
MTARLFVLDVPENVPIVEIARGYPGVSLEKVGPYFVLAAESNVTVDRRSTGVRHAVWYSWVGGLEGWQIEQWDRDAFRLVPR